MMKIFAPIAVSVVVAADSCVAWTDYNENTCVPCDEASLDGKGGCVREYGTVQTCYEDIPSCCKAMQDWSLQACIDRSTEAAPELLKYECNEYVGKEYTTVADCQKMCNDIGADAAMTDESFNSQCAWAHYAAVNNTVVPRTSPAIPNAAQNWIYGYSENSSDEATVGIDIIDDVETPAMCMGLCQENDECVNWAWASDFVTGMYTKKRRCILKSVDHTSISLSIAYPTEANPDNFDAKWCNYTMSYACHNLYECMACEGTPVCVWNSDLHITGWKYVPCADVTCGDGSCNVPGEEPTMSPVITSPAGVGSVSDEPTNEEIPSPGSNGSNDSSNSGSHDSSHTKPGNPGPGSKDSSNSGSHDSSHTKPGNPGPGSKDSSNSGSHDSSHTKPGNPGPGSKDSSNSGSHDSSHTKPGVSTPKPVDESECPETCVDGDCACVKHGVFLRVHEQPKKLGIWMDNESA